MTEVSFFAPQDEGALRVRLRSPSGAISDWLASPFDPVRVLSHQEPGDYVATLEPLGELPVEYAFSVADEAGAVDVQPPRVTELRSRSSTFERVSPSGRDGSGDRPPPPEVTRSSDLPPVQDEARESPNPGASSRRITVGLSENVPYQRAHWRPYAGGDVRVDLTSSGLDVVIADRPDQWRAPRLRISTALESVRVERLLVPRFEGGVRVTIRAGALATADLVVRVVPSDPSRRALVQALGARSGAEAKTLAAGLASNPLLEHLSDPSTSKRDPWTVVVIGLLATRFPAFGEVADRLWAHVDPVSIGWVADVHVLTARRRLTLASHANTEEKVRAAGQAIKELTEARRTGAPHFSQTNRMMGDLLGALSDGAPTDPQRRAAALERDQWRRAILLGGSAGPTFTWVMANRNVGRGDADAVPTVYAPTRGELSSAFSRVLFEGEVSLGRIRPRPPSTTSRGHKSSTGLGVRGGASNAGWPVDETPGGEPKPPAMARPILDLADPNKGRFGGRSSHAGFRLGVSFGKARKTWVDLTLFVACESGEVRPFEDVADFFLHDTFEPVRLRATFRGSLAQVPLVSSGGFTVGAWLPRLAIELELDLSAVPGAPSRIVNF